MSRLERARVRSASRTSTRAHSGTSAGGMSRGSYGRRTHAGTRLREEKRQFERLLVAPARHRRRRGPVVISPCGWITLKDFSHHYEVRRFNLDRYLTDENMKDIVYSQREPRIMLGLDKPGGTVVAFRAINGHSDPQLLMQSQHRIMHPDDDDLPPFIWYVTS